MEYRKESFSFTEDNSAKREEIGKAETDMEKTGKVQKVYWKEKDVYHVELSARSGCCLGVLAFWIIVIVIVCIIIF